MTWWTDDCGILDYIAISVQVICFFFQYGSNNGCWCVFCISSQPTTVCLVFSIVLTLTKPLGPMRNCAMILLLSRHTLPATFHTFLWSFDRVASLMIVIWSSIVIWSEAILSSILNGSTETVNDLLHFKYINEESEVLTTNQNNINHTGAWSKNRMRVVHCVWDYPCTKSNETNQVSRPSRMH
jgi:hypothetical protein